jgi:hypothetical protein
MSVVGPVESVWRYPVKSMRGEELREAFLGFAGSTATASTPSAARRRRRAFLT